MSTPVRDIKTVAEFKQLVESTPYVAIQAHAEWCGPCKAMTPIFDKAATDNGVESKYAFARFDTDEVSDLAQEFGIRSIPAFFFFENGEKVDNLSGANPPALNKLVATYAEKANVCTPL